MNRKTCLLVTAMIVASLVATVVSTRPASAEDSVPGFEMLRWGMSHDEFVEAMGVFPTFQTMQSDDNGMWVGGLMSEQYQFGGYTFKGGFFYFDNQANGLRKITTKYRLRNLSELMEIQAALELQYERIPTQRTEKEDFHSTFDDGYSYIHWIVYKRRANDDFVSVRITQK